jgi:hypothetical protein
MDGSGKCGGGDEAGNQPGVQLFHVHSSLG